jgi:hypothetical protein
VQSNSFIVPLEEGPLGTAYMNGIATARISRISPEPYRYEDMFALQERLTFLATNGIASGRLLSVSAIRSMHYSNASRSKIFMFLNNTYALKKTATSRVTFD